MLWLTASCSLLVLQDTTAADGVDGGERGLAVRYLKLSTVVWGPHEVREHLQALRAKDDEMELDREAEAARFAQLSLQPLYAKPPPIWLHPAFAAEFGDAFIGGTGLESGTLHVSLEVVVLALDDMLREGNAAESLLGHADRAALNGVHQAMAEAKSLAHKHVESRSNQHRTSIEPA